MTYSNPVPLASLSDAQLNGTEAFFPSLLFLLILVIVALFLTLIALTFEYIQARKQEYYEMWQDDEPWYDQDVVWEEEVWYKLWRIRLCFPIHVHKIGAFRPWYKARVCHPSNAGVYQ